MEEKISFLDLEENCALLARSLQLTVEGLDYKNFLLAMAGVESSFGKDMGPRVEKAYEPGGIYFQNKELQIAYAAYGRFASASFGPWQILYIVAHELGYRGHPEDLMDAEVCGPFVVDKLNRISKNGANSVERLLDAWNTGNWKDNHVPTNYIARFWHLYYQLTENRT